MSVRKGAVVVRVEDAEMAGPGVPIGLFGEKMKRTQLLEEVKFIPYYFRSNRGGRGEMRVGLRRLAL